MTDHPLTEAADLARIILEDSEGDPAGCLYTLNVREARTLAHVVLAAADLADQMDDEAQRWANHPDAQHPYDRGWDGAKSAAASRIRAALNGETHD